jgi:hypothetical protein
MITILDCFLNLSIKGVICCAIKPIVIKLMRGALAIEFLKNTPVLLGPLFN